MYEIFQANREMMHLVDKINFAILSEKLDKHFKKSFTKNDFFWEDEEVVINFEKRSGLIFLILNWTGEGRESKNKYLKTNDKIRDIVETAKKESDKNDKNLYWS